MYFLVDLCYVCLKTDSILYNFDDVFSDTKIYKLLISYFLDMVCFFPFIFYIKHITMLFFLFKGAKCGNFKICEQCYHEINTSQTFHSKHVVGINICKEYLNNLSADKDEKSDIRVVLYDIFKNSSLEAGKMVYNLSHFENWTSDWNLDDNKKVKIENEEFDDVKSEYLSDSDERDEDFALSTRGKYILL